MSKLFGLFIMGLSLTNCASKLIADDDIVIFRGVEIGRWGDLSFEQKMRLQEASRQDYMDAMTMLQNVSNETTKLKR